LSRKADWRRLAWDAVFYWIPLVLWMAWVFYWSSRPKLPRPNRRVGVRDHTFEFWAHTFTFAVLTILAWRAARYPLARRMSRLARLALPTAALFAAFYGASDELHQRFVPGRWPTLEDWLADMLGVAIAVVLLLIWQWLWGRWGEAIRERLPLPDWLC